MWFGRSQASLDVSILECGVDLLVRGAPYFHGFLIAREIKEREANRLLTPHGTLYKALHRMLRDGLLASEWEDAASAERESRPQRRLYRVTTAGQAALTAARATAASSETRLQSQTGPLTP